MKLGEFPSEEETFLLGNSHGDSSFTFSSLGGGMIPGSSDMDFFKTCQLNRKVHHLPVPLLFSDFTGKIREISVGVVQSPTLQLFIDESVGKPVAVCWFCCCGHSKTRPSKTHIQYHWENLTATSHVT